MSAVRDFHNSLTDWFETVVGVLQGYNLCSALLSILLEMVMALAVSQKDDFGALVSRWRIPIFVLGMILDC